jgi:hypothetical protein
MTELEQLKPTLAALTDPSQPDIPIHVDFQEVQDLLAWLDGHRDAVRQLADVGLAPEIIETVRTALAAARQAQSDWSTLRDPRKPADQAGLEEAGRKLRSAAVAACRFTLRGDRNVQGVLDRIVQGDGIADLVQDLEDLATLVEQNLTALAPNKKFDAPRQIPTLRDTAREIRLGLAQYRTAGAQKTAVDLRNRAWTWLDLHVSELRAAGRYAFAGTETAKEFRSAHERRSRLSRRRTSTDEADPATDSGDLPPPEASPEIEN